MKFSIGGLFKKELRFGLILFVVILGLNLIVNPNLVSPARLPVLIGLASPLIVAAIASTPAFLVGNGGIDISIGPVMGLVNVVIVQVVIGRHEILSPAALILTAVGVGLAVGLINGLLVAYLRLPPIVATLGAYLMCAGLTLYIAPTPGGSVPSWLAKFSTTNSWILLVVAAALWFFVWRLPIFSYIMATGGDERTVYTSGINTQLVRVAAFSFGGILAGLGGIALSAVLGSADPVVGLNYTLTGIAAAALGGVSLAGGIGGFGRAVLGAVTIFLLQNLLTYVQISSFLLQVTYGVVLVLAVAINGRMTVSKAKVQI